MFEIYRWASIILFSVTLTHKVSSSILIGCRIGIILVYILKKRGAIYKDSQYFLYKDMVRPRLVTFAYTAVLYVLYMVDSGSEVFIGAAISETVQQFVFIAVGLAFFEISKEKAIQNIFIAVLINYSVTLFVAFRSLGLSGVIGYLKSPGTALSSVTTYFEIHGLMFALGILLIYFILFENKSVKQHRLKILVCLFFVYCGYKRIEFLAVVLAMLMFIFLKNKGIRWIIFGGGAQPYWPSCTSA